jgi:hypothetical protein
VELGSAGGARRDRCHPGTPILRVDKRFPHAWRAFTWTKAGVELEIGFRDFEHLAAAFLPSRQRSKSVGTIGFVARGECQIADESGMP